MHIQQMIFKRWFGAFLRRLENLRVWIVGWNFFLYIFRGEGGGSLGLELAWKWLYIVFVHKYPFMFLLIFASPDFFYPACEQSEDISPVILSLLVHPLS